METRRPTTSISLVVLITIGAVIGWCFSKGFSAPSFFLSIWTHTALALIFILFFSRHNSFNQTIAFVRKVCDCNEEEAKKLWPLPLIFFAVLFNYTILKNIKDTVLLTQTPVGAELIPFLKVYINLPTGIIFTAYYGKLVTLFNKKTVFLLTVTPFVIFYTLFAFVIFPNKDKVVIQWEILEYLPIPAKNLISYWHICLLYGLSEIWGTAVSALLFWSTCNTICTVTEAKKYYSMFGIFANLSLVAAGEFATFVTKTNEHYSDILKVLIVTVVLFSIIIMYLGYYVLDEHSKRNPTEDLLEDTPITKKKPKKSFNESLAVLTTSKNLLCLVTLVISCGMSMNLVDVMWKSQMRLAYPTPAAYTNAMGRIAQFMGITTILSMLCGKQILNRAGWYISALLPPGVLIICGIIFFTCCNIPSLSTPVILAFIGSIQNILVRSSKYALFDSTKEIAFMSLPNEEERVTGKAAVDVIGSPLGKSGGSAIQQILILIFGSLQKSIPYLGVALMGVNLCWIKAVMVLQSTASAFVDKKST